MFNIIRSGNVVNITSEEVEFDVTSTLISGTSYKVANIEAVGYSWDVTYSGTTANIQLISGVAVSGGFWHGGNYGKMLYGKWATKQTLKGVTSFDTTLVASINYYTEEWTPRLDMTSKHIFIQLRNGPSSYYITRIDNDTLDSIDYDPNTENVFLVSFCIYNDNVIYTVEGDNSDNTLNLRKVTYTEDDYSVETVYSWTMDNDVYDGYNYSYWDHYFTGRIKHGSYDCIVVIWSYIENEFPAEPPHTYMLKFISYNVNTHAVSEQWQEPSSQDLDFSTIYARSTSPSFYQTKLIFALAPEFGIGEWPNPFSWISAFIFDVSNNLITKVEWSSPNTDWVAVYWATSTLDYSYQTFYFPAWWQEDGGDSGVFLFEMDINSPVLIKGDKIGDVECWQGASNGYCVELNGAPGTMTVRDIPDMSAITTVDVLSSANNVDSTCAIDIDEGLIWNVKSDVLEGKLLWGSGLTARDITVNWPGGSIPFSYPNNQRVWLRICNGVAVIMVYSRKTTVPVAQQQDFYVLKETI